MAKRIILLTANGLAARNDARQVINNCKGDLDAMQKEFDGIDDYASANLRPAGDAIDHDVVIDLVNSGVPIVVIETINNVYYSIPNSLKWAIEKHISQVH
jgi:hypothetical protein